jgi:hypothetical protein
VDKNKLYIYQSHDYLERAVDAVDYSGGGILDSAEKREATSTGFLRELHECRFYTVFFFFF